jgi:FkbM family methyltransferase
MSIVPFRRIRAVAGKILRQSPAYYWPVRVRSGLAKGARWTAFPYSSYWRGNTEMDVEEAIRNHGAMEGASCWDLGAHFGIYAVGMGMAVGPTGQVAAFEPNPVAFAKCARHVRMNHLHWVKLFNAGVADHQGPDVLILGSDADSSSAHVAYEDEPSDSISKTVSVNLLKLDSLVDTDEIRLPDFIKVDVEGRGAHALAGAFRSISASRPTIVMSFHSRWELEGTKQLLAPLEYAGHDPSGTRLAWDDCLYRTVILYRPSHFGE